MHELSFLLVALPAVFFVVDPLAALPIFATITANDDLAKRKSTAARAAVAAGITLSVFGLAGGLLFKLFGISLGAFKVAGGLMILLTALDMIRAQPSRTRTSSAEQAESIEKDDVAIVPLAIPMLSGPGAIATVTVLISRAGGRLVPLLCVFVAIALTCVASWLLLRATAVAERLISRTTLRVLERVMGLILAAVAVEFVAGGIADLAPRWRG